MWMAGLRYRLLKIPCNLARLVAEYLNRGRASEWKTEQRESRPCVRPYTLSAHNKYTRPYIRPLCGQPRRTRRKTDQTARRLPGGSAKLTDVSQSTGNRLPRPDHLVFYISSLLEPVIRCSFHPGVSPFCLHSFPCLFHAVPSSLPPFTSANPFNDGEGTELYCKSIYCGHSDGAPSFRGADYKFKCKPTRSRGTKVRNASSQVRPRVMRRKPARRRGGSPVALANIVTPRTIVIEIASCARSSRKVLIYNVLYYISLPSFSSV